MAGVQAYDAIAESISSLVARDGPGRIVGWCGAQGSGTSTAAAYLRSNLEGVGLRAAVLSLDDLSLSRAGRAGLAAKVHPLLAARGLPGTHDVELGLAVLNDLRSGKRVRIPRFDKALDDRVSPHEWDVFDGPADVILFEGWCVGARPQTYEALREPVNILERDHDAEGIWRAYVNELLGGPYQKLFAALVRLVLSRAPSIEVVVRWRQEQERSLRARAEHTARTMTDAEVAVFAQHYERLTRHIMDEMPGRADTIMRLGPHREIASFASRRWLNRR